MVPSVLIYNTSVIGIGTPAPIARVTGWIAYLAEPAAHIIGESLAEGHRWPLGHSCKKIKESVAQNINITGYMLDACANKPWFVITSANLGICKLPAMGKYEWCIFSLLIPIFMSLSPTDFKF